MIPAELERLVLCQKAMSKSVSLGRSGQMVIPVKDDKTVIIYHFDYFHFLDVTDSTDIEQCLARSVHQVIFYTRKSTNNFVIRDNLQLTTILDGAGVLVTSCNVEGYYSKDTYLIHDKDVIVSVSVAPPAVGTAIAPGSPPRRLTPEEPPNGYGSDPATAIPQTINEGYAGGIGEIVELSRKFGASSGATPYPVSNFRMPIVAATALNPTFVLNEFGQRSYPILNVDYVEINRNVAEDLFSTSS